MPGLSKSTAQCRPIEFHMHRLSKNSMRNPCNRFMGTSKNSEFAQMPHKGTPIRNGQKQPVRSRQQGVGKTSQRSITSNQPLGCRFLATKWNG